MLWRAQWETLVVSAEIVAALLTSLWLVARRRARLEQPLSDSTKLLQPRGCWSLRLLLAYRTSVFTFFVLVEICDVWRTRGRCLAFYTSWNFVLQAAYFAVAAWRSRRLLLRENGERAAAYTALEDDGDTPFASRRIARSDWQWVSLELLLDVCLATSLLICVVVWTVLYPYAERIGHPEKILNGVSYCQHGANVLLLQVDFFATRHSVSRDALPLIMAWPSVYAVFAWIVHGTVAKGFWPYPFLDLDTPWAPVWYGGILAAHVAALLLMMLLSRTKRGAQTVVSSAGDNA